LIVAVTGACLTGAAVFFITSAGASLTGSTFEIDGNLYKSTTTGTDWCNETEPAGTHTACVTADLAPNLQTAQDTPPGTGDDSFVGGTKQDSVPNNCPGDKGCVGSGSVPGKGDLDRFYLAHETGSNNHPFVYMGFELLPVSSPSASVHEGIEFNQKFCDSSAATNDCSANGVTPVRTAGDLLFVYDLEGGANPALSVRKWLTSSSQPPGTCEVSSNSPPCWSTPVSVTGEAANNGGGSVVDPINPGAPRTIQQFRFGEASVDLSPFITGCQGFASAYIVSRSSGNSDTAQMKDLISPLHANINACGTAKVVKQDDAGNKINGVTFNLYKDAGNDGVYVDGTDNTAANLVGSCQTGSDGSCTISDVVPGNYWFVEDTSTVPGDYFPANPDHQFVTVTSGQTVTKTFTNPRKHRVIVLVCHQGSNTLVKSDVSDGTTTKQSLDGTGLTQAQQAQLCGTATGQLGSAGAVFSGLAHGPASFSVDVGRVNGVPHS
jgi:Prealbumin-like fold domain